MPSSTLFPEDKTRIRSAIGHECQIFTATIIQLLLASPSPSQWSHAATGAIAFMKDTRRNNSFFFRLVSLEDGRVIWEQELYKDFQYNQDRIFFHSFATDSCMAAFNFADESEAQTFYSKVINRENLKVQARRTTSNSSIPQHSNSSLPPMPIANSAYTANTSNSSSGTAKKGAKKKGKIDKSSIGTPTNFRHLTHIGFDPEKGFSAHNIPPEWESVFKSAGVTEAQLKDKRTAKFIFDFMAQYNNAGPQSAAPAPPVPTVSADQGSVRRPPPPPSHRGSILPPQQQPTSQSGTIRRGPPPPPPSRTAAPQLSTVPVVVEPQSVESFKRPSLENILASSNRAAPPLPPSGGRPVPPTPPRSQTVETAAVPVAPSTGLAPPPPPPPPPPASSMAISPPVVKSSPSPSKKAPPPKVVDERDALMASIRGAGKAVLKPVTERESSSPLPPAEESTDIAAALKNALMARQNATMGDETEDEEEEDDW